MESEPSCLLPNICLEIRGVSFQSRSSGQRRFGLQLGSTSQLVIMATSGLKEMEFSHCTGLSNAVEGCGIGTPPSL